ncbi:MAG: hypothetical protein A3G26_12825 [Betaproteobacteria bacterium RIFCSPLOWO2_12_FULL_65_110]|nr:MAG: hypothetical protein A3G26_12825 [Betaproteobacteria bacterium RIFCSPLOWO2_12_FULL_65_110]
MPIYEYRCSSCGFQKEYLRKVHDPLLSSCPECGKASFEKMLTAAGFQLKGSGWYASDFKNSGAKPPQKEKTEAPNAEASKTEASKTEASKTEASKTDSPKTDSPKAEAPKTGAPKTGTAASGARASAASAESGS